MRRRPPRPIWIRFSAVVLAVQLVVGAAVLGFGAWRLRVAGLQGDLPASIVLAGVAGLALVWAAVAAVALRLSRQVERLAAGAAELASGRFQHRVEPARSRELRELAESLNDLADQLSSHLAELSAQRGEQEAILRSIDQAIVALDNQHRILSLNRSAREMLRLTDRDARWQLLAKVLDQPALEAFVEAAAAADGPHEAELKLDLDAVRWVRGASSPMRSLEGDRVGTIIMLSDVTRIRQLESVRTDFAANVSHELRTPITNIKGYVETLIELDGEDAGLNRKFLQVVARNAERLGAIVDDMLILTTLERDDTAAGLVTTPTSFAPVIDSVFANLAENAAAREIELIHHVQPADRASVNPRLAEQAITNLVTNAIKYSGRNTSVTVSAVADRLVGGVPAIRIDVIDEGPGIAPEHLPRIFERFYRVDKARSRDEGGTGLGLAICKHIALVHGGNVTVRSTIGQGSAFQLRFPIDGPPRRAVQDAPSGDAAAAPGPSPSAPEASTRAST